jgi:large subunit ribosomal protein L21
MAEKKNSSTKKATAKKKDSSTSKGYALIRAAGHQFTVAEGDLIKASFAGAGQKQDLADGATITIEDVLLTRSPDGKIQTGAPFVKGASVTLKLVAREKEPKVIIFKMKRRKGSRKKTGHRQPIIAAQVESIVFP